MNKLLVVVDFQNDFVDGTLGFEKAKSLSTLINQKVNHYIDDGNNVVFTMDTHYENYIETQEGMFLPVPHCIFGTHGWELYGELENIFNKRFSQKPNCVTKLKKDTFGCYLLEEYLTNSDKVYDEIEFCGVVTSMCVLSNAVIAKTMLPECTIIIDAECCSSPNEDMNNKALDVMENLQMVVKNR